MTTRTCANCLSADWGRDGIGCGHTGYRDGRNRNAAVKARRARAILRAQEAIEEARR